MKYLLSALMLSIAAWAMASEPASQTIVLDDSCSLRLIDPLGFQLGWAAPPWCYADHPAARDLWTVLDQTPAIDSDTYDVGGEESATQSLFLARGNHPSENLWFYDGIEVTDPIIGGATTTYFHFDTISGLEIVTGGSSSDLQTGGVAIRIVTKSPGNSWQANGSLYLSGDSLQSSNIPDELKTSGGSFQPGLTKYREYGLDAGGPILKDRLFAWGAFRRQETGGTIQQGIAEEATLQSVALKAIWDSAIHNLDFEYFNNDKSVHDRPDRNALVAAGTLRNQLETNTILQGIWRAHFSWIPNEKWLVDLLYGYNGNGFSLIPAGGNDVPIIYLSAIPEYEDTYFVNDPMDRPSHQVTASGRYDTGIKGTQHSFHFGFEYRTSHIHSQSTYGNGVLIQDYYQTTPQGPLTSGYLYAQRPLIAKADISRTSAYFEDAASWGRFAFRAGLRFDRQSGTNKPVLVPGVPGYEDFLPPVEYDPNGPGVSFSNTSPRLGVSFDATGDGKTLLKASYARYYDPLTSPAVLFGSLASGASGVSFAYTNMNGDRTISQDELTGGPFAYGPLYCAIGEDQECPNPEYSASLKNTSTNEWLVGVERELPFDAVVRATYVHRSYADFQASLPKDLSSDDYVPAGVFTANTVLGAFSVPVYDLRYSLSGDSVWTNIQDYSQRYNGIDLTVQQRSGRYVQLSGGLVLQRQKAIYDSPAALGYVIDDGGLPGSIQPFDPTNAPFLEGKPYGYSADDLKSGVYPYSEWQFKMAAVIHLPYRVDTGVFARYQQGYPYVLFASAGCGFECTSSHLILVEPFGSRRYDNLFSMDVSVQKVFDVKYGSITAVMDISNLTNSNAVTQRDRLVNSRKLNSIVDYVSPRVIRFGARLNF